VSSDELGAHVLELPYKGGDISLFVILPPFNKQRGISQLSKRLNTNILQNIVSSGEWTSRPVEVSLPKFNVEQSMDNLVSVSEVYKIYDYDKLILCSFLKTNNLLSIYLRSLVELKEFLE